MLTLDHPEIMRTVRGFPGGLLPIRPGNKLSLAIKASKEALLAIQQNGGFSVYVVPIAAAAGETFSIVTAFFDDADEPLVIRTPLFGDEQPSVEIVAMLTAPAVDIYFFDNLGREWMSYTCAINDPGSHLATSAELRLASFSSANSLAILNILQDWFGLRTAEDDARAIKVVLGEALWPSDLAILDAREGVNKYIGSDGFSINMLERDATRPGYYQERDIVAALKRFLDPEQIILNPFKRRSDKEFADVVAGTDRAVLFIQAKDSPNTPTSLARTIARKESKSKAQLAEALNQVRGALRYAAGAEPVTLTVQREDLDLYIAGRTVISVAIIREIFPSQENDILGALRAAYSDGRSLVILDYPGFCTFVHHFPDEHRFVEELEAFSRALLQLESWITPDMFLLGRFLEARNA